MKKTLALSIIAIIVVGVLVGLKLFVDEPGDDQSNEIGYKLAKMESDTDEEADDIIQKIKNGDISKADCFEKIKEMILYSIDNLNDVEYGNKQLIDVAYNCNVVKKLAGLNEDKKSYEDAELQLRQSEAANVAKWIHSYCIDVYTNSEETSDKLEITTDTEELKANIDVEIEQYVELLFEVYQ